MGSDAGDRRERLAEPGWPSEQFTVPLPGAAQVEAVPPYEPTRAAGEAVDPLLGQIGVALFWITIGWWVFFLLRVLGYFVRFGGDGTILIRTIDLGAEETILAAVLSVLAALLLLFGRGSRGRSPLGYAAGVLAVATVAITVWRLVP